MSAIKNQHGLQRNIPKPVERAVRQRDGFGCVICGKAIYDYEHFDPEFADALQHSAAGIVLLCIEHHGLKTRGLLSKDTIRKHIENPKTKELGFSFGPFDIGTLHPEIQLGKMQCTNVETLISLDGEDIFSINAPIKEGLPFRINANLCDEAGKPILSIIDNEWRTPIDNWDVNITGAKITIRQGLGDINLVIRSEPPKRIVVERLKMNHRGHQIICHEHENLEIRTRAGQILKAHEVIMDGQRTAIKVENGSLKMGLGGGYFRFVGSLENNRPIYPIPLGFTGSDLGGKTKRLAPCPCHSGFKYKKCHGRF